MPEAKATVAVTRRIPAAGLRPLEERYRVRLFDSDLPPERLKLLELLRDADGALTLLSDIVDYEILGACSQLKIVANCAVGYENVDVDAATKRGIWVTNTPEVLTDATADLAMTLILCATRRIVEADRYMRSGKYRAWDPRLLRGRQLTGKTLGVVGLGRIGRTVAQRAKAFGMKIVYTDPQAHTEAERELGAFRMGFRELLFASDVITLHAPYSPELHHLMDAEAFAAMKPTAYFINTARGRLMDERALLEALKSGEIAGAGLDVYENEPEFEHELAELDNVVLLPHIGSATHETRDAMAELAARNIVAVLEGRRPPTPVNEPIR